MKEIKFRAWEEANAKMRDWEYMKSISVYPGHSEWEWSQFIGLKDGNGNDIYEGDVLKDVKMFKVNKEIAVFRVDYIGGSFCLTSKDQITPIFVYDGKNLKNCEIIGNVYENPELGEFK